MAAARRNRRERGIDKTRRRVAANLKMRSRRMNKLVTDVAMEFANPPPVQRFYGVERKVMIVIF